MDLVAATYELTKKLPKEETFGLIDQMRRAAVSIPSNISEGQSRKNNKEFLQFLYVAKGSKSELETQVLICEKIGYLTNEQTSPLLDRLSEISKMISSLIKQIDND